VDQRLFAIPRTQSQKEAAVQGAANLTANICDEQGAPEQKMLNKGKKNIIGILIDAVDYEAAADFVVRAARERRAAIVSALAVHGLMTGVLSREQKFRLNQFDLLLPDGQPVRWAINGLYRAGLSDRVYGPNFTLQLCARAAAEQLPIYFYGSTPDVLCSLKLSLERQFPGILIAGMECSKFRPLVPGEKSTVAARICDSGASIVFVGLGCPRQEVFAYEFRNLLPMPVVAVGAAFPFLAGKITQAPQWMQNVGLEWLFRLAGDPRRLWRRYVLLNPTYILLVLLQLLRLSRFSTTGQAPSRDLLHG
jgi:N-acetylglucosaminyldiphosphoundecaprenol N-acetyl-beta-D-mannosaminyltransferase